MRSVPRELLIHSAEVRTPLSEDSFGSVILSEGVQLRYVRIDSVRGCGYDGMRKSGKSAAVLIYDCRNSLPRGFEFSLGQRVYFGGAEYTVASVEKFYEKRLLHHIEAALI